MIVDRLAALRGIGGKVTLWTATDDRAAVYVGTETDGVGVVVGLSDDDVRQLVAVLERQLRTRSAGRRRLDPAGECVCGHPRTVHTDQEAACRDDSACPCLVMRPVAVVRTVQSCTVLGPSPAPDLGRNERRLSAGLPPVLGAM